MRAVLVERFGGPEVLVPREVPDPVAEPGQVVIGVAAAAIDFVQTQLRGGFTPGLPMPELPYVPGTTVAGEVIQSPDPSWMGRRVITRTPTGYGGYAERAVADVDALIPVPEPLGLLEAAALLDDGGVAVGLIDNAAIKPGEWVLVEAAAGGLGSLLVQLATAAGAQVIGAARGSAKLDLVRELGALQAVDYSEPGWAERVRELTGGGPNLVFDGVGGNLGRAAFEVTARGGRFSVHGVTSGSVTAIDPEEARRREITVIGLDQLFGLQPTWKPRAERALAEAAAGRVKPIIGQTFPLSDAADAHAAIEARAVVGKTLLLV
jgi:NADPH:quinone reductase